MLNGKWLQRNLSKTPTDKTDNTDKTTNNVSIVSKVSDPLEQKSEYPDIYSRMKAAIKNIADIYSPLIDGAYQERMKALDWLVCSEKNPEVTPAMIEQWEQGCIRIIEEWRTDRKKVSGGKALLP